MSIAWNSGTANPVPFPIPLGATGTNSTNPNPYGVFLKVAPGTATISNITIGGVSQGSVVAGTFLVTANGSVNLAYSAGTPVLTTYATGLTSPTSYPWTDPMFQLRFTVQQFIQVSGVTPGVTDD